MAKPRKPKLRKARRANSANSANSDGTDRTPANRASISPTLSALRQELDHVDSAIVKSIARRFEIVNEVGKTKFDRKDGLRDPAREREVLNRAEAAARDSGVSGPLLRRIFADIIAHSVSMQSTTLSGTGATAGLPELVVACNGDTYSYDHLAAEQYLDGRGLRGRTVACHSLRAAVDKVNAGDADLAILPIENTFAGSKNELYDLLLEHDLHIVGEETFKIDHCLVARPGTRISFIERVHSHPQILEHCSVFLDGLAPARAVATWDTSEALRTVAQATGTTDAAIAAAAGAAAFGLEVLRHAIGNQTNIQSRFVALARTALPLDPRVSSKTSLVLTTAHEHGALQRCLQILSDHGVNLTKLESRPRPGRPWEYMFFVDFEGHIEAPQVGAALRNLHAHTLFLRILGCYPAKATPSDPQPARIKSPPPAKPAAARKNLSRPRRPLVIRVDDLLIGGDGFALFAGPPFVESQHQIDSIARYLRGAGAHVLHANVFPATLGETDAREASDGARITGVRGLALLAAAGKRHGIAIMTEVLTPEQVKPAAQAIDVLHVGGRNMQNEALLREVGRVDCPVVLDRGEAATVGDWLDAAAFISSHGNRQVMLCERGGGTLGGDGVGVLDLAAVAGLRENARFPVLADVSRGAGHAPLTLPMARAARACGAHGVVIAVHADPAGAGLGRADVLTPTEFSQLVHDLATGSAGS